MPTGLHAATSRPRRPRAFVRDVARRVPAWMGVLAYHRVAPPDPDDVWGLCVSPQHFDEQLGVLGDIGRVVPLEAALGSSPISRCLDRRRRFVVTFDDGYVDNFTAALPLLERHDAPATIFVVTGMIDEPSFWWDEFLWLLRRPEATADRLRESVVEMGVMPADQVPVGTHQSTVDAIYATVVALPPSEVRSILEELRARLGVDRQLPSGRPMTTDELVRLAAHPLITIGLHTMSHRRLTLLSPDEVRRELTGAASHLGDLLGEVPRLLAYPYGAYSFEIGTMASTLGVRFAVTTESRPVGIREHPMWMPRLTPSDLDGVRFRDWILAA